MNLMKFANRQTGLLGEGLALQFLLKSGLELISRNFSTRFGKIDLIMKDKGVMIFVEVKTKKGLDFGTPEEMLTQGKLRRLCSMVTEYLKVQEVSCPIGRKTVLLNPVSLCLLKCDFIVKFMGSAEFAWALISVNGTTTGRPPLGACGT